MPRVEQDIIGKKQIDDSAYYGIHAVRAKENFPDTTRFSKHWYAAVGTVKKSVYLASLDFQTAAIKKHGSLPKSIKTIENSTLKALIAAAEKVEKGEYFEHFIVPAISGGAGTSINMNINEIITNIALTETGREKGKYESIHPIEHANIYQSTNDVIPTALKVALMQQLTILEKSINEIRKDIETLENTYRHTLRIGYTQLQEAVPTTFGRLFSTYNDALSRDWWRVSKCFERIKTVNLGGSAIGTGLTVPTFIMVEAIKHLQQQTGLPIAKAENLSDQTSNLDGLVEISAILKAHAVNLEKMTNDLRLLSSDLSNPKTIEIPSKQTGSSIMPGKINPVITEFTVSSTHKIYANDGLISSLAAQGNLELNAYIPVIGHSLLENIGLLIACNHTIKENLIRGLVCSEEKALNNMLQSPGISTILIPYIGYTKATEIAQLMKKQGLDIKSANKKLNLINESKLEKLLKPENIIKEGFRLKDILDYDENKGE